MNNKIELKTQFDHAKSFYKKAYYTITEDNNTKTIKLYSYYTDVLTIIIDKIDYKKSYYILNNYSFYSNTTARHTKEAIQQFLYNTNVLNILYKKGFTKNNIIKYSRYNKEEI